jgi:hypothetical protein
VLPAEFKGIAIDILAQLLDALALSKKLLTKNKFGA